MLIDARDLPHQTELLSEVCVVGAGPAGIAVARELQKSLHDVVLVEAGGTRPDLATETLSSGEIALGSDHVPLELYRRRVIGGSSYVWGGRCTPFDPLDFEKRSWIPESGWPLSYSELLPWYERANSFLDAGRFAYDTESAAIGKQPLLSGFSHPWLHTNRIERFSRPSNVGRLYADDLQRARSLRLVHHGICTALDLDRDGRSVRSITVRTFSGSSITITAQCFVLSLGTIETVRLLLAANRTTQDMIGNNGGWLGRNYLSHLEGTIGEFKINPAGRQLVWGYEKDTDGIYIRRRFAVSAAAQERHQTGNAIARFTHPQVADPSHGSAILSAAYLAKNFLVPEYSRRIAWTDRQTAERLAALGRGRLLRKHASNIVKEFPQLLIFGPWWAWNRSFRSRKIPSLMLRSITGTYELDFNIEQSPNPSSRIVLADSADQFGVPHVKVDWKINDVDRQSILGTLRLFREAFESSGCGSFTFDEGSALERFMQIGGHQMGGARMASDPKSGVVDTNCRVHGISNLFLAGNQVFPTVSYANPTLTNVALALRLADHMHSVLTSIK